MSLMQYVISYLYLYALNKNFVATRLYGLISQKTVLLQLKVDVTILIFPIFSMHLDNY
jgi:hypothetical protein